MVYSSRDSSPTRRLNTLPSSTASPSSSSPSRSRLSYSGGRPPSFAGPGHPHPQGPQHPSHSHHPSPSHGQAQGLTLSSSAILERRDVKPDEEMSGKGMVLLKNEGLYADPYTLMHDGRLSIASTQSLATISDPFGFPVSGGLYRRGSVRSLSTYSAAALQSDLEDSLYKPGGSLYFRCLQQLHARHGLSSAALLPAEDSRCAAEGQGFIHWVFQPRVACENHLPQRLNFLFCVFGESEVQTQLQFWTPRRWE